MISHIEDDKFHLSGIHSNISHGRSSPHVKLSGRKMMPRKQYFSRKSTLIKDNRFGDGGSNRSSNKVNNNFNMPSTLKWKGSRQRESDGDIIQQAYLENHQAKKKKKEIQEQMELEKETDEKDLEHKKQMKEVEDFLDHNATVVFMTLITIYALFFDDLRLLFFDSS